MAYDLQNYETVSERTLKFYREYPEGRIETSLEDFSGNHNATRWVMRAAVYRDSETATPPAGVGYAFEIDGGKGANRSSALENCETSAIGRALAAAGFASDKQRATREEMRKVAISDARDALARARTVDDARAVWTEAQKQGVLNEVKSEINAVVAKINEANEQRAADECRGAARPQPPQGGQPPVDEGSIADQLGATN
ncbi:hypothetical protein [Corynebacterium otitidis]|uniref:hypothetical protein n=1 Tax=Corynebacterium otitidis TaxID=29321 RepID=UPI000627B36A|nr:hypothetical protein [Corynebacterium otitidis]KKO84489.1 hypothetical protein AAV33_00775 [Corynebacterium otitidis]